MSRNAELHAAMVLAQTKIDLAMDSLITGFEKFKKLPEVTWPAVEELNSYVEILENAADRLHRRNEYGRPYLILDCWGEPAHAYVGDIVHYKLGHERLGKITEIDHDGAKVNGHWFNKKDLWME